MNPQEYKKLCEVESQHWFYKGKRDIALTWIKRLVGEKKEIYLVDVGAGTGIFVKEASDGYCAFGVEPSSQGITLTRTSRITAGSILNLPLKVGSVDVATSMDVLEHIDDHRRAMEELVRIVRKDGIIFITVPAGSWAMSDWDISLGHYRRYDMKDLDALLKNLPVKIIQKTYINVFAFFPVVIYRFLRKCGLCSNSHRLEDVIPPQIINQPLYYLFVGPSIVPHLKMPFGLSLMVILQKI